MPRAGSCVPTRDGHRGEVTWPAPRTGHPHDAPGARRPKARWTASTRGRPAFRSASCRACPPAGRCTRLAMRSTHRPVLGDRLVYLQLVAGLEDPPLDVPSVVLVK